jgi:hypothetical protein
MTVCGKPKWRGDCDPPSCFLQGLATHALTCMRLHGEDLGSCWGGVRERVLLTWRETVYCSQFSSPKVAFSHRNSLK